MTAEFSVPAEESPAPEKPPVDPFWLSPERKLKDQQRAENAKIIDQLDFTIPQQRSRLSQGEEPLAVEVLETTIKSDRLLKLGLKGPDDIVFGYIETTDGKVTRQLSLVMPLSTPSAGANFDDTLIFIQDLETHIEGKVDQRQYLKVDFDLNIYDPAITLAFDAEQPPVIQVNGQTLHQGPPDGPIEPKHTIRTSLTLSRNQVCTLTGLTRTQVSNKDGTDTERKITSTLWVLW